MKKFKEYAIIRHNVQSSFNDAIEYRLNAGWVLVGGISMDNGGNFMQAMVK